MVLSDFDRYWDGVAAGQEMTGEDALWGVCDGIQFEKEAAS